MGIRVLLADDHRIMREGLKSLLEHEQDLEIVGEAANGYEAVRLTEELKPDVVVMDLNMPKMSGIEAIRQILSTAQRTKALALSMALDRVCVVETMKAGASGYLLKDCAAEELVGAIHNVMNGELYLCSKITELVVKDYMDIISDDAAEIRGRLTRREREVLELIAEGKNTKEIAFRFGVSVKTTEVQRSSIMKKLNLFSIAELTKYAIRHGLTTLE